MIILIFGFVKKLVNTGSSVIKTPISIVQDVVTGDIEMGNTTQSLDEIGEDLSTLLEDEEEDE